MPPKKKQKKSPTAGELKTSNKKMTKTSLKRGEEKKTVLEAAYGLKFPGDLYGFWNFCCEVNSSDPLESLSCLGMRLVGPFEVLAKKIIIEKCEDPFKLHLHWRFYYDPPEFMTVIISEKPNENLHHLGYLRDDPNTDQCLVVSNSGQECKLKILGDNLFSAIRGEIQQKIVSAKGKQKTNIKALFEKLDDHVKAHKSSMEAQSTQVNLRNKAVVAKTFHGAGIVVPIDENGVGYRPLHETDTKLKRMFKKIDDAINDELRMVAFDELQEMITYIQFANDECDYGMGLELGMNMFCYGSRYLNKACNRLLTVAYGLLKRDLYAKIIVSHLVDRRKVNLSRSVDNG